MYRVQMQLVAIQQVKVLQVSTRQQLPTAALMQSMAILQVSTGQQPARASAALVQSLAQNHDL